MSSAHRPTWTPAQGKEGRNNSKSYSSRDLASHTKLKFRQPGQGTANEVQRRDLKLELLAAERDAAARKAKGERGFVLDQKLLLLKEAQAAESEAGSVKAPTSATEVGEDEQAAKRRKLLQEAADLDRDDSDDEDSADEDEEEKQDKGKGKAVAQDEDDEDEDSSDEDDDEDETAELLRELEKIKKERAEEKARQEAEREATEQVSREEEIATGNPLLNLQAALGHSPAPSTISSSTAGFGVKRRWDDDVIFRSQANKDEKKEPRFVNDLLRALILARHGQSETNAANIFTGLLDPPLTARGVREAQSLGNSLKQLPLDRITHAYTSPLRRAHSSLSHLLEALEQPPPPPEIHVAPELNERDYGLLNGRDKTEVAREYGVEQTAAWRRGWSAGPPGGESLEMTTQRVYSYYRREVLPHLQAGETVLVVSHGNTLRGLVKELDGLGEDEVMGLQLGTGAMRIYRVDAVGKVVERKLFLVNGLEGGPQP
ncbi:hypothetical protein JCM8097_005180 [Rhodosporidiobolus ruineniae]